jgi:hypothetical protein
MDYDDELNDDEERAYRKEVHGSSSSDGDAEEGEDEMSE